MHRILIVEDNDAVRESLRDALASEGYLVDTAASAATALTLLGQATPSVVLLDLRMPDVNGSAFAERLAEHGCSVPIIVVSADRTAAAQAKSMNAAGFIAKPFDLGHLIALIEETVCPSAATLPG